MRTSLNEIRLIDGYLFSKNDTGDKLLFDAMLVLNPNLPKQITWQKKAHAIVSQYGRKQIKTEVESVHLQLFTKPEHRGFRERVLSFFK